MVGQVALSCMFWLNRPSEPEPVDGGAAGFPAEDEEPNQRLNLYVDLTALVVLTRSLRILFYFRGNLRLGAFVHKLFAICGDLVPIAGASLVVMFSFSLSLCVLLLYVYSQQADGVLRAVQGVWTSFNLALRLPKLFGWSPSDDTEWSSGEPAWEVLIIFEVFVLPSNIINALWHCFFTFNIHFK